MSKQAGGLVTSVDHANDAIMLSDGSQLMLDPNASITKDGKKATLADIKEGDQVRASFAPGTSSVWQLRVTSSSRTK
jgi:hypothetical protein